MTPTARASRTRRAPRTVTVEDPNLLAALAEIAAAGRNVATAHDAWTAALQDRAAVLHEHRAVIVELGPVAVERLIGGLIGESTIRAESQT